jgi:hypothetical protein
MIGFHFSFATIGPHLVPELVKNLHLWIDDLSVMLMNTDRINVHCVMHHMQHALNLYKDLGFIIKKNLGKETQLLQNFLPLWRLSTIVQFTYMMCNKITVMYAQNMSVLLFCSATPRSKQDQAVKISENVPLSQTSVYCHCKFWQSL